MRQNTTIEKLPKDTRYMLAIFGITIMTRTVNQQKTLSFKKMIIFVLRGVFTLLILPLCVEGIV